MMTDCEFLLAVLEDGRPHSQAELLKLSFEARGCGLTIHSRVADLRKKGFEIDCAHVPGESRGRAWTYVLREPAAEPAGGAGSSSAGSRSAHAGSAASAAAAGARAVPLQLSITEEVAA